MATKVTQVNAPENQGNANADTPNDGHEWITAPGPSGADDMLSLPNSGDKDDEFDFGFDDDEDQDDEDQHNDEDDEEDDEDDEDGGLPPGVAERLAAQETTIAQLQQTLAGMTQQQQQQSLDALLDEFENAKELAQDDKAAELRKKIIEARSAISAPAQQQQAGQVSADFQDKAKAWLDRQQWYGTDYEKTAKFNDIVQTLNPAKYATPEQYIAAVEGALGVTDKGKGKNTPNPRQRSAPNGAGAGDARPNPRAFKEVKSISQLKGAKREAAETSMRVGGLTEAQYLASFNATEKAKHERRMSSKKRR